MGDLWLAGGPTWCAMDYSTSRPKQVLLCMAQSRVMHSCDRDLATLAGCFTAIAAYEDVGRARPFRENRTSQLPPRLKGSTPLTCFWGWVLDFALPQGSPACLDLLSAQITISCTREMPLVCISEAKIRWKSDACAALRAFCLTERFIPELARIRK